MESLPQASASLPWSVHKIGGTSIARYLDHIVDNIVAPRATSERLVIVCSARSLASKAKGTTSTLLEAAEKAAESRGTSQRRASDARGRDQRWRLDCFAQADPAPLRSPLLSPLQNPSGVPLDRVTSALLDRARERSTSASTRASSASTRTSSTLSSMRNSLIDFADIQESPPSSRASVDERFDPRTAEEFGWLSDIQALQEDHFAAVRTHCQDASIAEKCLSDLSCDFDELYAVLAAVETLGFLSAQMKERIVAFGELWSTRVLTAALCSKHLDASVVRLDSLALDWDTCSADQVEERVVRAIRDELAHNSSRVLVVPGYYGPLPYALLETVGRGYSDRCASLCADALSVSCMFIWKEVAGILQANPNVAADAKVISAITRREAHELAKYGNEVINAESFSSAQRSLDHSRARLTGSSRLGRRGFPRRLCKGYCDPV
ncbi:Aspartate/glutamate/uridylate kinase [Ceraceosorus guamensis]|uniref:Aspartate/glutamate/uridylate kinase n=1 Tax=Ceraceosorus guamensis TaxID=1522189 RepID=A0A316VN65_9BASI|nr:Aspartate/glutamate/uridylate kinase [Ceraceosorus guamensis]PWN39006.1 Aspartate/glutamate/uridylate kinase [Ceraceosorus guamensis]